jgi:type III secretion system FlhB-like substrate exporter
MAEKAIALRYADNLPAPFLLAKGRNRLAEKIIALAMDAGIPVVPLEDLVDRLFLFDAGSFIPEDCFEVVAGLLAYVYSLDSNQGKKVE